MTVNEATANAAGDLEQTRRLTTEVPGPRSRELAERAAKVLPRGLGASHRTWAARSAAGIVEDVDGNLLIDLGSGIATTTVGNAHPEVAAEVARQAQLLTHTCFTNQPYEPYLTLCERLVELAPGDHEKRAALFSTGAESVENAVKYARAFTGRSGIVVFDHAFHGRTNMTMGMTAKNNPYKKSFGPFPADVHRTPSPYALRWEGGAEAAADGAMKQLELLVDAQVGSDTIACVVLEPIQGEGGFIVPPKGFLPRLADFCRERDILFIADEVQTGIARTGSLFACQDEGVVPDLMTLAKGLGGGMPISAVVGRADVMDSVHPGGIGGTYAGNPVACAAALKVLEIVERDGLCERARAIGARIESAMREAQAANPAIGEVRGRGAMMAIELVKEDGITPDAELTSSVVTYAEEHGVVVLSAGTFGNVIRFLPPLSISDDLLDEALSVVAEALSAR